jgi:hypothetical protein
VVSENALSSTAVDELHDFFNNGRTIRTAIHQVAKKYEVTALRMRTIGVVAEPLQELLEHLGLTMYVADDVQRDIREILD